MEHFAAQLRQAMVSDGEMARCLQQARAFHAQIQQTFAPGDAAGIFAARTLMVELHIDQARRPDGTLYIEHPLAVASQVCDAMAYKDPVVVVAALLHDAVEDQAAKLVRREESGQARTRLALDVIEAYTQSARVRRIVAGVTNPDFDALLAQRGIVARDNRDAYLRARNELYAAHVCRVLRDPDQALVKLFDLLANALTLAAIPDVPTRTRLLTKYLPVLGLLLDRLQETASPLNITPRCSAQVLIRLAEAIAAYRLQSGEETDPR